MHRTAAVCAGIVLLVGACGSPRAASLAPTSSPSSLGSLTAADVAFIHAHRTVFSTDAAASVVAIRAPGSQVFELLIPGVSFGAATKAYASHPLLVVVSRTDVPQTSMNRAYGSTASATTGVLEIYDTTSGQEVGGIVATSPGGSSLPDPAVLGAVTTVRLTD